MERVLAVCDESFRTVRAIVRAAPHELPAPDALRLHARGCVQRARAAADARGMPARDADEIAYALVALVDEAALARGGALREAWQAETLQLSMFGENTAGEGFFVRLAELRRDASRREVLAAYWLVLALGFRGRYAFRGAEIELAELFESVRLDLVRFGVLRETVLAPSAKRPRERLASRADASLVLAVGVAGVALSMLLWLGLRVDLALRVRDALAVLVPLG